MPRVWCELSCVRWKWFLEGKVLFQGVWLQCQPLPTVLLFIIKWCNMELLQSYCFHRGKHLCLITCLSGQFLSVNFVFLKLLSRKKGILLLKVGLFVWKTIYIWKWESYFNPGAKIPSLSILLTILSFTGVSHSRAHCCHIFTGENSYYKY